MNNINSVTVVSAYYKIPSKRTHSEFDIFINNFLNNINCNLIIFTSKDLIQYFKNKIKDRTNIILIIKEFDNLEIYKKYNNIWDSQYLIDDQKNIRSKYCYIIWNSKLNFIKEAIEINYFNSDKFIWNDIGSIRNSEYIDLLKFYPLYDNISNIKIDIILLNSSIDENKKYFKDEIHFSGAIFGGVINVLLEFHKLYYEKFDEYLKNNQFIGCDQQMILSVYLKNKELFNAINPFIDNINENNLIIPNKNKDRWFYLYHYYSYNTPNPLKTCLVLGESHEQMIPKKVNSEKYVIFRPDGRLGNAIFRYLACILFSIKNNQVYILESECPKLEEYNFYEGVDYIGNDIGMIQSDNIEDIKKSLYYNDNTIAFNSLGFYKSEINFNNLKSSEYINGQNKLGLYVKNIINVTDDNFYNYIDKDLSNYNILMNGYFQFNNIYLENKIAIMKYIENYGNDHYIHTCTLGNQDLSDNHQRFLVKEVLTDIKLEDSKIYDIVIHLRLGDFVDKDDFIDYIYLEELFSSIDFSGKRSCFVVEKPKTEFDFNFLNKCLEWFQHKNIPINVESNSLMTDFNIMKNTEILACSMSTLSWCAAFFSKKIELCIMPDYNFDDKNRKTFFKNPIKNTIFYKVKSTK